MPAVWNSLPQTVISDLTATTDVHLKLGLIKSALYGHAFLKMTRDFPTLMILHLLVNDSDVYLNHVINK